MFQPSPYQARILEWVVNGKGSVVVIAVAGAGKTKLIELTLPVIPESEEVQLFAFNSSIAKELNARIEKLRAETGREFRNLKASTFHSVGFGAVCKALKMDPRSIQTDSKKCIRLAQKLWGSLQYDLYGAYCAKLVGLAKGEGIGVLCPDTFENWYGLVRHHDLHLDSIEADEALAIQLAQDLLRASNEAAKSGLIDFDDQLYLPLLWKLRLWPKSWVIVDEAQDTNPVRRAMAKLALKPGGRLMAVGDPKQAIYGFTGASHDAIDIIKREFNAVEMPLTVCYRCSKAVVAEAAAIVPYLEAHEAAPEGLVSDLDLPEALKLLGPHDAILCRNVAPLIDLAYSLLGKGIGCAVAGKEIGTNLINLIKKMNARDIDGLLNKLAIYRSREVAKFVAKGEEGKAEAVEDRVASIEAIIDHLSENQRTIAGLLARIEGLFSDSNGVLMLSSIHKAKGREWRRVGILAPGLMPSKWARQEWQMEQEKNLQYVAYTRAQEHLIFLTGTDPVPRNRREG